MSGRINPREYDLGELRDAVREATHRDDSSGSGIESDRSDGRVGVAVEFREGERKATSPVGNPSERERQRDHSVLDDPEAYIRSRHRRANSAAETSRGDSQREEHEIPVRTPGRDGGPTGATASRRTGLGSDLELLASPGVNASKPYLAEIPGTYGAQSEIFEWLNRLVSKAGRGGAVSALEYYESIEWLSAKSRAKLETFVDGIGTRRTVDEPLGVTDHRESLAYIARIAERSRSNR